LIDAEEALDCGLVNSVVPGGELLATARKMADSILRHPTEGVVANKRAIVGAQESAVEAALQHAAEVQPDRFTSDEFRTAVRAALK
jgi:2-(1,2-epoxy-1,2-dihydrophenyl)acetyl-CoA isomerase